MKADINNPRSAVRDFSAVLYIYHWQGTCDTSALTAYLNRWTKLATCLPTTILHIIIHSVLTMLKGGIHNVSIQRCKPCPTIVISVHTYVICSQVAYLTNTCIPLSDKMSTNHHVPLYCNHRLIQCLFQNWYSMLLQMKHENYL